MIKWWCISLDKFNVNEELSRTRVLLYQYILHKGDFYRQQAKSSTERLQRSKYLTVADFERIYKDLLLDELFDIIQKDLCDLFDL